MRAFLSLLAAAFAGCAAASTLGARIAMSSGSGGKERHTETWTGLKFTSLQDGSTVSMEKVSVYVPAPDVSLLSSTDGGDIWEPFIVGETSFVLDEGESVCLKAGPGGNARMGSDENSNSYNRFRITGSVAASGSLESLLNAEYTNVTVIPSSGYMSLFYGCTGLASAPELPVTNLSENCYYRMFGDCTGLTSGPPALSADSVPAGGYSLMFSGCTNLVNAPVLEFTAASESSTGTLRNGALLYMFRDCAGLRKIRMRGYSGDLGSNSSISPFYHWAEGLPDYGILFYDGPDTNVSVNAIPPGWEVMKNLKCTAFSVTSTEPNTSVSFDSVKSTEPFYIPDYEISTDSGASWTAMPLVSAVSRGFVITAQGETVYVRGDKVRDAGSQNYVRFHASAPVKTGGNIMSLAYKNGWDAIEDPLPSRELLYFVFARMFSQAGPNLLTTPVLPVKRLCWSSGSASTGYTLYNMSYTGLFAGCSKVCKIYLGCEDELGDPVHDVNGLAHHDIFTDWVSGVAPSGTLHYNGPTRDFGPSAVPPGWVVKPFVNPFTP